MNNLSLFDRSGWRWLWHIMSLTMLAETFLTCLFPITGDVHKPHILKKEMQGYTKNLLGCQITATRGDAGSVQTDKVMQIYEGMWRKNYSTSCLGLKIISRHFCNALQNNAASSSTGSQSQISDVFLQTKCRSVLFQLQISCHSNLLRVQVNSFSETGWN